MKKTGILLGCALFASTPFGAYAADTGFSPAALDICTALGQTGITVGSADTCLLISGEVVYDFEYEIDGATRAIDITSEVDWELSFDAASQTGFGKARAVIVLTPDDPENAAGSVVIDKAYVSIGDSTVLTAGQNSTLFPQVGRNQQILSNLSVSRPGGHVIQLSGPLTDTINYGVALEDLEDDGALGTFATYRQSGIHTTLGGLIYNLYDIMDGAHPDWRIYGNARYNPDTLDVFGAFVADATTFRAVTSVGVSVDDLFLKVAWGPRYTQATNVWQHTYGAGFELALGAFNFDVEAQTVEFSDLSLDVEIAYTLSDSWEIIGTLEFDDITTQSDAEARLALSGDLTETLEIEPWIGARYVAATDQYMAGAGGEIVYKPGGGFETSAELEVWANGDLVVAISAEKSF